ncbi:MAG TPA: hypothetical protein GX497_12815 [Bacillus bacterium]|nr:hypothetical protein [Bacillus sp. (in: firmicutes)]
MNDKFTLVTTISGKTYKFRVEPTANMLIDLPNKIIIGVVSSISRIDCYLPDKNDIYHYAGDLGFQNDKGLYSINFHSRAIAGLSFNRSTVPIPRKSNSLCDVKIDLEIDKSSEWFKSLTKDF